MMKRITRIKRVVIIALSVYVLFFVPCLAETNDQLIFSLDIIRHGDRNPGSDIPTSPYKWPRELGALTELGIEQEYQLGILLRREYIEKSSLLSPEYREGSLYVRSTAMSRTIESAESLLKGLYPMNSRKDKKINIETVSRDRDDLLLVRPSNNPWSMVKVFFKKRSFWQERTKGMESKLEQWSKASGINIKDFESLDILADNLHIRLLHDIPLPLGFDKQSAQEIVDLDEGGTLDLFRLPEISAPTGKNIMASVYSYVSDAILASRDRESPRDYLRYVLYSGHDSTIMSVLSLLGALEGYPGFASRLNFSLFKINNSDSYQIRVTLNGNMVQIPGCNRNTCTIAQFKDLFK